MTRKLKHLMGATAPEPNQRADQRPQSDWHRPISAQSPCGDFLEYDAEYAVLAGRLSPQTEVQYGQFTALPPGPDWLEVERDARRLLLRSKDITLLVWLLRARVNLGGAQGLHEGLEAMQIVLHSFAKDVHPQHHIEGMLDPAVRANALAALSDPEGLLVDIRDIVVTSNTAARLTVRDIESAMATRRPAHAMQPDAVKRQLADLHNKGDERFKALLASAHAAHAIQQWCELDLGDHAPDLAPLLKLLRDATHLDPVGQATSHPLAHSPAQNLGTPPKHLQHPQQLPAQWHNQPMQHNQPPSQREHIRQLLGQVQEWVETHEPSSPVGVLLKQAQRMWGKRFSEVAHLIPANLLREWDTDSTDSKPRG